LPIQEVGQKASWAQAPQAVDLRHTEKLLRVQRPSDQTLQRAVHLLRKLRMGQARRPQKEEDSEMQVPAKELRMNLC